MHVQRCKPLLIVMRQLIVEFAFFIFCCKENTVNRQMHQFFFPSTVKEAHVKPSTVTAHSLPPIEDPHITV